jgi:hypothetical protein
MNSARSSEDREPLEKEEEPQGQGEWILNLEPVPLVVREENLPSKGQASGQGDGLLDQGPGQAIEELDWLPPVIVEETWLNEGVEIPDTVELPELEDPNRNTQNSW